MSLNLERWGETLLGAIVVLTAAGFLAFAIGQGGQSGGGRGSYDLVARFNRVDGVAVGSDVRVSGVKVGVVRAIELDPETYLARVTLAMDRRVRVLDDSTAQIKQEGLLGGQYVLIEPAGLDPLPPGGEIPNTQGSVDLLSLFASFAQNSGQSRNEDTAP